VKGRLEVLDEVGLSAGQNAMAHLNHKPLLALFARHLHERADGGRDKRGPLLACRILQPCVAGGVFSCWA
jgi:hypothetical protein